MAADEAMLRKNWKITVGICSAYLALIVAFTIVMMLTVTEPLSTTRTKRVGSNPSPVTGVVEYQGSQTGQ